MSATLDSSTGLRFASGDAPTAAEDLGQRLEQLNAIGASLSAERAGLSARTAFSRSTLGTD